MKKISIDTGIGTIWGRDGIFLDKVEFLGLTSKIKLIGELNGNLLSQKREGEDISFEVIFFGVMAMKLIVLEHGVIICCSILVVL